MTGLVDALRSILTRKRLEAAGVALAFFAGLALVAFGAWLVYRPAGFALAGIMLASCAVLYVRAPSQRR